MDIKRDKGGKLGSLILIILLILFVFSTVAAATCTYTISPTDQSFSSHGGTDSISVTTQSGCSWTATGTLDWVSIASGSSGTGSGAVTYSVSFNETGQPRKGTITIGNQTFTIRQAKSVFNDVTDPTYWAYPYIYAIYTEGITVGCGNNNYCPNDQVTRGQMAAFIIRAKYGENFTYTQTPYFSDVPSTHGFFKYVQRLKDDGITSVSGTYGVDAYVTRGQTAAFIIRALYRETFAFTMTPYFTDVPATHTFFKYVQRLKDEGITAVAGTYNVDSVVTREQMAAFIYRAFLVTEASETIGSAGGTVEVTNPSSPLYGVKIEIPEGALHQDTTITINKGGSSDSIVNIGPSGTEFLIPVTITIPYEDEANEMFLAVFTSEEGETNWTHNKNYIIDTISNKASFNISHLSNSQIATFKLVSSEIKIYFKGGSRYLDNAQNETAKVTIREVIMHRVWSEFYNCAGLTVKEVNSESEANIVIQWEDIPDDFSMRWNPESQRIEVHQEFIPAETRSDCYTISGIGIQPCFPKAIILNERMFYNPPTGVHIALDENVGSSYDLYSIIAHEFGHVLGLPDYHDSDYPENAVTDDQIKPREIARVLQPIDKTKIIERHPECQCANIAGTWNGTSTPEHGETINITFILSQVGCNITGTWESSHPCISQCGLSPATISGSVSENTFSFTSPGLFINCNTCEISCYITHSGSLTIDGNRMYGTPVGKHCDGSFYIYSLDLTRSGSTSSLLKTLEKQGNKSASILDQQEAKSDIYLNPITGKERSNTARQRQ